MRRWADERPLTGRRARLAPTSVNLRLSEIRKLAAEAAENDLLNHSVAQGIVRCSRVRME